VKHRILGWLSDKTFLLTNIIPNHNEIRLSDEQILEIYEQPKHQDRIGTTLQVSTFTMRSASTSNTAKALQISHLLENGTVQTGLQFESLQVLPTDITKVPLIQAHNFRHQKLVILPTSQLNRESLHKLQYVCTSADLMSVCLDLELILARSGMLLDYHIILTTFRRRWGCKYSLITIMQDAYKNAVNHTPLAQPITVTKANAVFFKQAILMWRLSRKRMVCLSLTLFRPANEPFCQHKEVSHLKPTADFVDAEGTCRF
jgi:hypothetical protein